MERARVEYTTTGRHSLGVVDPRSYCGSTLAKPGGYCFVGRGPEASVYNRTLPSRKEVSMEIKRMKLGAITLLGVGGAMLLGAMLGRAQTTFPVRFDDPPEGVTVTAPSWAAMGAVHFAPQDKPPVRCDASNVGFFYIQRDTQGGIASPQVNTAPCYCTSCVDAVFCTGATGYADPTYYWLNTAGQACANLWIPEPPG